MGDRIYYCSDVGMLATRSVVHISTSSFTLFSSYFRLCCTRNLKPPGLNCSGFSNVTVHNKFKRDSTEFEADLWVFNNQCSAPIMSGVSMAFKNTDTLSIRTRFPRYYGMDNINPSYRHMFHDWNVASGKYGFTKKIPNPIPSTYTSHLLLVHPAFITTTLELHVDTTHLYFLDPFFVEGTCNYTQPKTFRNHTITNDTSSQGNLGRYEYGGVFLDQDPSVPGSPYYSLRASKYLDISGNHKWPGDTLGVGESFFTGWTMAPADSSAFIVTDPDTSHQHGEYDTKAVIFKEAGAEITASYKAHLITGKPSSSWESRSALSPNSQRKVDWVATQDGQSFQHGLYQAVYDLLGREVSILTDGYQPAGKHTVRFKAGNLPAGLYLYRLSANGVQITRKMLIQR